MIDGKETFWEALKRHGVSSREFMKFSAIITGLMGLPPAFIPKVVEAMETKPRVYKFR